MTFAAIRAVLFDADGTLFDFDRAQAAALSGAFGLAPDSSRAAALSSRFRAHNREVWAEHERGLIGKDALRTERFRRLKEELGFPEDIESLAARFLELLAEQAILIPGAEQAIAACRERGLKLGLATNGFSAVQRGRLSRSPLRAAFDGIFISEEMGSQKPDRAYFEACLAALGASADEALFVGDSPEADIAGAAGAGMRSVWINAEGRAYPPALPKPSGELSSIGEFPRYLAEEVEA
jgi:YjjG family noncanonical pyrimidine nucleotidase